MADCIFCRMARKAAKQASKGGEVIKTNIVYEDDKILAFRDLNPQAPVHILIIPREHIATVLDIKEKDTPLMGRLYMVAADLARKEKIDQKGFRLVVNCNRDAGQAVFHLHLHLLAGRRFTWPPG